MKVTEYELKVLKSVEKFPMAPMGGDKRISRLMACQRLWKKGLLISHRTSVFTISDTGREYLESHPGA